MNLLSRLKAAVRSFADPSPEVFRAFGAVRTGSGVDVTPTTSMSASSVFACVRNIAEDVSKLPLILHRTLEGGGKERLVDDPLYTLLHDSPNPEMGSMVCRQAITGCAVLGGNGYAEIERNGGGKAIAIWPLMWNRVQPKRNAAGDLYYLIDQKDVIPAADMLHITGFSMTGVLGEMITVVGRESIGLTLAAEKFAASFFGNGAIPGGVLKHKDVLGEEGVKNLQKSWKDQHQGPDAAHNISILEEGMEYEKVGTDPEEAQMVQSRQFQVEDIARWFRVPPHKVGHLLRSTFSNIEHQSIEYVVDTLTPWCVKWEQEVKRKLVPAKERKTFVEHLFTGLLRGDTAARYEAYQKALTSGWMNRDEVRSLENLNPIPDGKGKVYLMPLNMGPTTPADKPPAVPPANPPAADDLEVDPAVAEPDGRAAIVAAHKVVLADTFARLVRIESDKRSRSKADAAFWLKHREHVAECATPALRALAVSLIGREPGEDFAAEVAAVTELHLARAQRGEGKPEDMADIAAARLVEYAERSKQ